MKAPDTVFEFRRWNWYVTLMVVSEEGGVWILNFLTILVIVVYSLVLEPIRKIVGDRWLLP